jgi:hypothetical protein
MIFLTMQHQLHRKHTVFLDASLSGIVDEGAKIWLDSADLFHCGSRPA